MAEHTATVGHMVDGNFKAEGQMCRIMAASDADAIDQMWAWVRGLSPLFPVTHVRLSEVTGPMNRRVVGIWPLEEAPKKVL